MRESVMAVAADLFPRRAVYLAGEGQLSVAVRVDEDLLLRFPRHAFGVERLAFEVRLLECIRPHLHVAVPEVVEVALDESVGRAYVAHRYLPGQIVRRDAVAGWPEEWVRHVGTEVGTFVRELHPLSAPAKEAGARVATPESFARSLGGEFDASVAHRTNAAGRARARRETAALAALPDHPLVLCHTDLGGNILFDEDTGAVGVIDFGSCMVTHPAFELATLSVLGDDFVNACRAACPDLTPEEGAAEAVRGTFALQDALYGARQQDWPYVDDVLARYARS